MRTFLWALVALGVAVVGVADTASADPLQAFVECFASAQLQAGTGGPPTVTFAHACVSGVTP